MHILFIPAWFETPDRSTAGKAVKDLAYALAVEGIKVNILFQSGAHLPRITYLNHQIEVWNSYYPLRGKLYPVWNLGSVWAYHRLFKKYIAAHGLPDLIHIHSYPLLAIARLLNIKYTIPVAYTEHSSTIAQGKINLLEKKLIKKYLPSNSIVFTVSEFLKSGLSAFIDQPVTVIPNTIDFNCFIPGQKSSRLKIIMINLLNKNKQVDLGIRAFAKWSGHSDALLYIIGDGPERKEIEKLIVDLNMGERIKIFGEQSVEVWLPLLQESSALLLLSRLETFGVVVLEALACGVPVVALENHGIVEVLKGPAVSVLPVEAKETEVANALDQILKNGDSTSIFDLRSELKAQFDYPVVARKYISAYQTLLKKE